MRSRWFLVPGLAIVFAAILLFTNMSAAWATPAATRELSRIVKCRVMETHMSAEHGVTLVIFHQSTKEEQARLADLLKRNSGAAVEWQKADGGEWRAATVIRMKSCFGRGLLLLPAGTDGPGEGEHFLVKFPEANAGGVK